MVKHAADESNPLLNAEERVDAALARVVNGKHFAEEQQQWLDRIRRHMIENLSIEQDDFDVFPILERGGGWGRATKVFAGNLPQLIHQLNETPRIRQPPLSLVSLDCSISSHVVCAPHRSHVTMPGADSTKIVVSPHFGHTSWGVSMEPQNRLSKLMWTDTKIMGLQTVSINWHLWPAANRAERPKKQVPLGSIQSAGVDNYLALATAS